jgi:hypothetical protein
MSEGKRMDKERLPKTDNQPAQGVDRDELGNRLRKVLKARPSPKLSPDDQRIVAEALYRLMQRVEKEHGEPKAKVIRKAQMGGDGDSTKHLSHYAIRPGANAGRLRQKVEPYVKLTETAAKLAGIDETEALLEVFGRATSLQTNNTESAPAEFVELAGRLRFVMEGVAREQGLTEFFQAVERGGGVLAPAADCWSTEQETGHLLTTQEIAIEFYFGWGSQLWPIEFFVPTEEAEDPDGDHIPAYPSLIVGAWWLDSTFPVSVTANVTEADGIALALSGTVEGRHEVELRLCIVPVGSAMHATPALRVQLSTALSPLMSRADAGGSVPSHARAELSFPWAGMPMLKRGRSKVAGRYAAGDKNIDCDIYVKDDVVPRLLKEWFVDLASSAPTKPGIAGGVRFLPITGAVCEDWFGFAVSKNYYDPMQQRIADRAQGFQSRTVSPRPNLPPLNSGPTPSPIQFTAVYAIPQTVWTYY